MKNLLFYCQHILGVGHLVRSMAIAKGLTRTFNVYFVNGGETTQYFPLPNGIEMVTLPAIKTDPGLRELQVPAEFADVDEALAYRRDQLLALCDRIRPDVVLIEMFPFGRRRFSTELIPLIERARAYGAKISCSLRDIVVTQKNRARYEAKVCKLINCYFDQLLIHGDPALIPLEKSFSRVRDLTCEVHYTGYVVPDEGRILAARASDEAPTILVSTGGGRFGHELLYSVACAARFLEDKIPHQIQMFTGPFTPKIVRQRLKGMAKERSNLTVKRYTSDLLTHMGKADLSISTAGYNTLLNVMQTGVRSMVLPCTGNNDWERQLRCQRLEKLGAVYRLESRHLSPTQMGLSILNMLNTRPPQRCFHLRGVEITAARLKELARGSYGSWGAA